MAAQLGRRRLEAYAGREGSQGRSPRVPHANRASLLRDPDTRRSATPGKHSRMDTCELSEDSFCLHWPSLDSSSTVELLSWLGVIRRTLSPLHRGQELPSNSTNARFRPVSRLRRQPSKCQDRTSRRFHTHCHFGPQGSARSSLDRREVDPGGLVLNAGTLDRPAGNHEAGRCRLDAAPRDGATVQSLSARNLVGVICGEHLRRRLWNRACPGNFRCVTQTVRV